jgi:hypothetical protein
MTYSNNVPNAAGWWYWKEDERAKPERLLIVASGTYAEVATDEDVIEALGIDPEEARRLAELGAFNYWEMTDCRKMGGLWKQETPEDWIGKRVRKKSVKPFSDGLRVAKVTGITTNPHMKTPTPAFELEDNHHPVNCSQCVLVEDPRVIARLSVREAWKPPTMMEALAAGLLPEDRIPGHAF